MPLIYRRCCGVRCRTATVSSRVRSRGELAIEEADRVELVLNMKTATVLGIKVPRSVPVRADPGSSSEVRARARVWLLRCLK